MSFRGGLDLEGRIVIKVQLGNDVRKMLIHNDDITYDELVLMMQRIYKGAIKQDDELTLKYKDEDGDLITIFDSSDVSFALQTCNRQLKLVLYVNGLERNFDDAEIATIRKGLCDVRDMANRLLDQINAKTRLFDGGDSSDSEDVSAHDDQPSYTTSVTANRPAIDSTEFDPLAGGGGQATSQTQQDSTGGDKSATQSQYGGSQYGGSQYGDQVSKSFDHMSVSDSQSANTAATLQSSFGAAFNTSVTSQPMTSAPPPPQAPVTVAQQPNMYSSQAPASTMSSAPSMSSTGYYANPAAAASTQYSTPQTGLQQTSSAPPQQQQFNYGQWRQQMPGQQTTAQQMPGQQTTAQQMPGQQTTAQPMPGQQMPPQQQQYGGYNMPGQQPQQQGMYGQPQLPTPGGYPPAGGASTNPYSNTKQIRGSYPRATGNYPQLQQPGPQHPGGYPGAPQQ